MSSTQTFVDKRELSDADVVVHHLPFKIEYEGDANVEPCFTSQIKETTDGDKTILQNQFRGRPLQGEVIKLPEDYIGLVLEKSNVDKDDDETVPNEIHVTKEFKSFYSWNWDRTPTIMDSHHKLAHWLLVAESLHAPISKKDQVVFPMPPS